MKKKTVIEEEPNARADQDRKKLFRIRYARGTWWWVAVAGRRLRQVAVLSAIRSLAIYRLIGMSICEYHAHHSHKKNCSVPIERNACVELANGDDWWNPPLWHSNQILIPKHQQTFSIASPLIV